ncbi:Uncharacterised protein [Mycobacteroides abscessus subsp. abscessus]|nr:Uncharacterised protein [Mycobacteroides abscessus subsp. abscessus]
MVDVVVSLLPVLGRIHHVPLPAGGVNLGIVHPIPLAVHDVVADFHVLDDLGHTERHRARPPGRALLARRQQDAAGELQCALGSDGATDIAGVSSSERFLDIPTDRVQLVPERLNISLGEVREFLDIRNRHP